MAVSSDMTTISAAENTTNWSSSNSIAQDTENKIEGIAAVGIIKLSQQTSTTKFDYGTQFGGNLNVSAAPTHFFIWGNVANGGGLDTQANGGVRVYMEDNAGVYNEWYVAGSNTYSGGWRCFVAYTDATANNSNGAIDKTNIKYIGITYKMLAKTTANVNNAWVDIMRRGSGLIVTQGTSGTPLTWEDVLTGDQAGPYGVISKTSGVYVVQGKLTFGDTGGTDSTYFADTSQTIIFADAAVDTNLYDINVVGHSATTTSFQLGNKSGTAGIQGCFLKSEGTKLFDITATDTNVNTFKLYGCSIYNADSVTLPAYSVNSEVINCTFEASGEVLADTCTVTNCNFVSADDRGLRMSSTSNNVSDSNFISCGHGVHIPNTGTYTFDNLSFTGNTYDIENSSAGLVTVDATNNANPSTYENTGGGTTVINNAVQLTITVKDEATNPIENASVGIFRTTESAMTAAVADDGGAQTDETTAANNATANDMTLLPATPAVNDAYYFGAQDKFWRLELNVGTNGSGTWTITWEYYDETGGWTDLSSHGLNDGSNGFTAGTGTKYVRFDSPTGTAPSANWTKTSVNGVNAYWIRARVSAYTSITTQPLGTQSFTWNQLMNELTNASGVATESYNDPGGGVPINIRVRKSTTGTTRYFPISTSGTISGNLSAEVVMIQDDIAEA
jgi:hypothetical protein